jgi:endoglucanase
MNARKIIGIGMIILSIAIALFVAYKNSRYDRITRSFSPYTLLQSSWIRYSENFINEDGRVVDDRFNDITTSEGQSYAMLRAVWVDDRETFDRSWTWTKENLDRESDNLFGWRWGRRQDGSYGFLEDGGENSASDADSDIALSLILASRRWNRPEYAQESKQILPDIWDHLTREVQGKRYLIAGNWADLPEGLVINPSYFSPYAWRIFAEYDEDRDWNSLIDPAYELLERTSWEPLDREFAVGLPPDWVVLDRENGNLSKTLEPQLTTNYSFDALRVPWRIALDYVWNEEEKAKSYLEKSFKFLSDYYSENNRLAGWYSHDGQVLGEKENPAMYAASLGYFSLIDPEIAGKIYQEKIIQLYATDQNSFRDDLPYYEQNWLWFGAALQERFLEDFNNE